MTRIHPKIRKLAKTFGIEFRIGDHPKDVKIMVDDEIFDEIACYFGDGVIFIKKKTKYSPAMMDMIALHEVGHAISDFFIKDKQITRKMEEVKANAIALAYAAILKLPVPKKFIENCVEYTKQKKVRAWNAKGKRKGFKANSPTGK